jgi:molybdopterin synthase catalytic subunit
MVQIMRADVTTAVINVFELANLIRDESCGAIVTFSGEVRNHDCGKEVVSLTYEIHPSAPEKLTEITQSVAEKFQVQKVAIAHRYGEIPIGQTAFAVVVSAHHRESAFEACSALVNEVKEQLPIWKHQVFKDGSDEWVNTA